MMNIVNGGAHAENRSISRNSWSCPLGLPSFAEALRAGTEVFHHLKKVLHAQGLSTAVGDEGGFAPDLRDRRPPRSRCSSRRSRRRATRRASEIAIAMDVAASELFRDDAYGFEGKRTTRPRGPDGRVF